MSRYLARLRHVRDRATHVRRAGAPFPEDLRQALHLRLELVHRRGAGAFEVRGAAYELVRLARRREEQEA